MNKLKLIFASFIALIMLSGAALPMTAAAETSKQAACSALGSSTCAQPAGSPNVDSVVKNVILVLSLIVGVAAVIMVIVGGFKFITSGGDSNKAASARNTVVYALVGLVIVAFAQAIVYFVIGKLK